MAKSNSTSTTNSGSSSVTTNTSTGGSSSHTESGSSSETHSSSKTKGISLTNTTNQSHSTTTGETYSQSSSKGGSQTSGSGKTWASGQVADRTQQKFNEATQDYVRSQKVEDAYANLQSVLGGRPAFQSQYEDKLSDMYNRIMNREAFSYDFNKDAMYQAYKDMYQRQGKQAMQDTMGQLSAMNSGYGSSYAQTAGQQTYQNYLQTLNDRIPELREAARDEYDREGNRLMQQYQLTNDAYNREYGQYRDSMSDWQSDRGFNQSAYQDERNFDYNKAMNDRNFWQNEYWQERNAEQSNVNESQGTNWSEGTTRGTSRSTTDTTGSSQSLSLSMSKTNTDSTTNTSGWSDTNTSNWSNSTSATNSSGWSTTNSSSNSSGSGGSGGSGGKGGSVPYSQSSSLPAYSQNQREADIDLMAQYLNSSYNGANASTKFGSRTEGSVNQKELGKMIVDLKDNGSKSGKTRVDYDYDDIARMMNNADAIAHQRQTGDSRNGNGIGSTYYSNRYTAKDIEDIYNAAKRKNYNYWG